MSDTQNTIDELLYASYKFNRLNAPQITPAQWATIYKNAAELENMFQTERAIEYLSGYGGEE